ncbi:MAG: S53 family peptidase, partial [Cyanobacteria bacterium]|nr:S53 family peptidase [Cyanobacteriota bacterium]
GYLPSGVWNSVVHNVNHPIDALSTFGMGAGMAVVLKTVLPEGGLAGKLAGAAIGAYFTYQSIKPLAEAYGKAGNAVSMRDLDLASRQIGNTAGTFLVDSAIAAAGYKVGSHYTGRVLSSQAMDGFADAKANFYNNLGEKFSPTKLDGSLKKAHGLRLAAPELPLDATYRGELNPSTKMDVSVMLKSQASDLRIQRTLARIAEGRQAPLTDHQIAESFSSSPESLNAVTKFANENGLQVKESNLNSGRVVLSGSSEQFARAFDTKLSTYELPGGEKFFGRQSSMSVPSSLSSHINGVLGLDTRPQMKPHFVKLSGISPRQGADSAGTRGFMPNEVADAYNFPKDSMGKGQNVAIIELGGGMDRVDNAKYYQRHGLPEPKINIIEVGEGKNKPGHAWDSEVMLDSQVIGVVAPEATQSIIFAANSEKGFADAVLRAAFPEKAEGKNSVISISWGLNEEGWSKEGIAGMNDAFKKAALKGISIFASAGDDGARDRSTSGKLLAHYPASDPHVTASGGTRLLVDEQGKYKSEKVWNNGGKNDAGGGGISEVFPPQEFQKNANVPPHASSGKLGRGVPDIAGNADPVTGYNIRVHGSESLMGGTSAVAPLYAALMLRINGAMDKPFSAPLNAWLYENSNKGFFNDVTIGDNGGYKAGPGWDAASGLGSIDGSKLFAAIKANPYLKSGTIKFPQFKL